MREIKFVDDEGFCNVIEREAIKHYKMGIISAEELINYIFYQTPEELIEEKKRRD